MAILIVVKKWVQPQVEKYIEQANDGKNEDNPNYLHVVYANTYDQVIEGKTGLDRASFNFVIICGVFIPERHTTQYDTLPRGLTLSEVLCEYNIYAVICSEFDGEGSSGLREWAKHHARVVKIDWCETLRECLKLAPSN